MAVVGVHLLLPILVISAVTGGETLLRTTPETVSGSGDDGLFCDSWRLSVETNNAGAWVAVPSQCAGFLAKYMNGEKYKSDSAVVAADSLAFAKSIQISGDGKDTWIFDVDDTLLSNLPYYADRGYGTELFNETQWNGWVAAAKSPSIPESLGLYEELLGLGFNLVLLTGRSEDQRNDTERNLLSAGYHSWEKLMLRSASDIGKPACVYKSEVRSKLAADGYRIHGNSGDQWSDLLEAPIATRSFKIPNPLYCVP